MLHARIHVLGFLYIIASVFDLPVKMNLNYIWLTSSTLKSSTKFHVNLTFLEVKYVDRRVKEQTGLSHNALILLGFRTLSIVRIFLNTNKKTQRFGNWICFRPQVREDTYSVGSLRKS
jgi:hypothetical protein